MLGMEFLAEYNPRVDFVDRVMTFPDGVRVTSDSCHSSAHSCVELCSL